MKTAAIIQARMGSTRLPGKVMMDICGKPAIERLVDRLSKSTMLNQIIIATGIDIETSNSNKPIRRWGQENGIPVFTGSEDNVLGRVLDCAKSNGVDRIVDITGDCPLIDYRHVDEICIGMDRVDKCDYGCNITPRLWPDGFDVQVYWTKLLEQTNKRLGLNSPLREHVGINVLPNSRYTFSYGVPVNEFRRYHHPDWGLTLDTAEDLTLIRKIFAHFIYKQNYDFSAIDIIDFINENPHLLNINSHIKRKGVAG